MKYKIKFSTKADKEIKLLRKSGNKQVLKKLSIILKEMESTPYTGIGQPELLKYKYSGFWSRRLDKQNRIVYRVFDDIVEVLVLSVKGHYEDK